MQKLCESNEFITDRYESFNGQMYSRSPTNRIYLTTIANDEIVLSESNGLGGSYEVTARGKLIELNDQNTTMELAFKCGAYNLNIFPIVFLFLITAGIIVTTIHSLGILIFLLSLYPIFVIVNIKLATKKFLKKISSVLDKDNNWY